MNIPMVNLKAQQESIRHNIEKGFLNVLDHGKYIMGPEVVELEQKLSDFSGVRHSITCSNGTDALILALLAMSIKAGDYVLVPSFTFCATAEAVVILNAIPIFVDIDPDTFNINHKTLENSYQHAMNKGIKPKGVISVDLFGQPCNYNTIEHFCKEHDLWLICDSAQSFGAKAHGKRVGNFGDITTTSFYPSKPLGGYGDGGAVFTNDDDIADKIKSLRNHGEGSSKYHNIRVGLNARLNSFQAVVLLEKLKIFENNLIDREKTAKLYDTFLNGNIVKPQVSQDLISIWAQYTIKIPKEIRQCFKKKLDQDGISTCIYYPIPIHRQKAFQPYYTKINNNLYQTEKICHEVISLPISFNDHEIRYISDCINNFDEQINKENLIL